MTLLRKTEPPKPPLKCICLIVFGWRNPRCPIHGGTFEGFFR